MRTITKRVKSGNLMIDMDHLQDGETTVRHGDFVGYYPDGKKAISGSYVRGKPNGKWLRWYSNGQLASTHQYVMGVLEGEYQQYFENGDIARKGIFAKGKPDGEILIYLKGKNVQKRFEYDDGKLQKAEFHTDSGLKVYDVIGGTVLPSGNQFIRYKKICTLRDNGELICKTPAQIVEDLSTFLDPESVDALMSLFNQFYDEFGLDSSKEILVGCGESVHAVNAVGGASVDYSDADTNNLNRASMSQQEIDGIYAACRDATWENMGVDTGSADFENQRNRFVEDSIGKIEEGIHKCQDDWYNPMISALPALLASCLAPGPCQSLLLGVAAGTASGTAVYFIGDALSDGWGDPVDPVANPRVYYFAGAGGKVKKEKYDFGLVIVTMPANVDEPGTTKKHIEFPDGRRETRYYDDDGNLVHREDENGNPLPLPNGKEEKKTEEPEPSVPDSNKPDEEPDRSPPPLPEDDDKDDDDSDSRDADLPPHGVPDDEDQPAGGMPNCEALESWWQNVKAHCAESDWKTYECLQILRVFNFCADPALVYPNPDGTATCMNKNNKSRKELEEEACKQKGTVMQTGTVMLPSGFGGRICQSYDDDISSLWTFEPCTDPRAQCAPHLILEAENQWAVSERTNSPNILAYRSSNVKQNIPQLTDINPLENIRHLSDHNFDVSVKKCESSLIVVFGAKNCPPCKRLLRNLEIVETQLQVPIETSYVEVAQNPGLATKFDVKHTPTIVVLDNNGEVLGQRRVGAATKEILIRYINRCLGFKHSHSEVSEATRKT